MSNALKLSFPREKRRIRFGSGCGTVYLIVGRGMSPDWFLMDFWRKPYAFKTYADALKGARKIGKEMKRFQWKDDKPVIAKVTLGT